MKTKLCEWTERCFWLRWILACDFEAMAERLNPPRSRAFVTTLEDGTAVWSA